MAELRPYEPTWRDRIAQMMMGDGRASPERRRFVEGLLGSSGLGNTGMGVVDVTPVGGLLQAQEAVREGDPRGAALSIFAGPAARTANRAALKTAQEMATKGASRDAIWNETGWFKGVDGGWRFEIPDNQSFYRALPTPNPQTHEELLREGRETVGRQLIHDQLYAAYPEAKNVSLFTLKDEIPGTKGTYMSGSNNSLEGSKIELFGNDKSRTILHELQHGLQDVENFARGANPDFGWSREMVDAQARKIYERPPVKSSPELEALAADLAEFAPKRDTSIPWDQLPIKERVKWYEEARDALYRNAAGEVEARNVEKRMNMTPEQRRATPPWLTQDVPDELQIIRGLLDR